MTPRLASFDVLLSPAELNESLLRETDRHLKHMAEIASGLSISVTCVTEIGSLKTLLPKRVRAEHADLVFYPLTPTQRLGVDPQQHTIRHLLRTIPSDLAIMRIISMAKPHPGKILVPLGKNISSMERRLKFVSELARSFQSQVTLYHLTTIGEPEQLLPDNLILFGKQLQQQNIAVLERHGAGELAKAITVEAITRHNDLIVLGATGRGIVRRIFSGNPAADLLRHPPCNSILFRGGETA